MDALFICIGIAVAFTGIAIGILIDKKDKKDKD